MAIQLGDNFQYKGKKPLDERNSFDTLSNMINYNPDSLDEGHISYCKETNKYYTFNSSNSIDSVTGKWRELNGEKIDKASISSALSSKSTDEEVPSAKTVYDSLQKAENSTKEQFNTINDSLAHIENAVDGNIVELNIKGLSVQNKYTGKNILHKSLNHTYKYTADDGSTINTIVNSDTINITNTANADGKFVNHFAYTWTTRAANLIDISKYVGKKLVFSVNALSGTITQKWVGFIAWSYKDIDGDATNIMYFKNNSCSLSPYGVYDCGALEVTQDFIDTNGKYLGVNYWISNNNILTNFICKLQIEVGETATEYEPYVGGVPSPNPNYPQKITSMGEDGDITITSSKKNLIKYPYYQQSGELNGITYTVNEDGSVIANGTTTTKASAFDFIYAFNTKLCSRLAVGKTYSFTDGIENPIPGVYSQLIRYNSAVGRYNWALSTSKGKTTTFTLTDENLSYFGFRTVINAGTTVKDLVIKPQLEINTESTNFEKYEATDINIKLSSPLRSIGDLKDEITYQDGKLGILRRIGKISVDGNTNKINFVAVNKDTVNAIQCNIAGIADLIKKQAGGKLLCNRFIWSNIYPGTADAPTSNEDISNTIYEYPNGKVAVRLPLTVTEITDVDTANKYFKDHPFDVLYELANTVFEPFEDQSLQYSIPTFKGVTNISNDMLSEMSIKFPLTDSAASGSKNEAKIIYLEQQLQSMNKITTTEVNISFLKLPIKLIKNCHTVVVSYGSDTNDTVTQGDLGKVGTLPDGFIPVAPIYISNINIGSCKVQLILNTDGTIKAYNYGEAITSTLICRYNGTYICK